MREQLRVALFADVAACAVAADNSSARRAVHRLHEVAQHAPAFMCMLAEPWLAPADADADAQAVARVLLPCARIHLYARALDDALDENLPHDRLHLLRMQPVFWRAVYALGSHAHDLADASAALILETVDAVARDDRLSMPDCWGAKNHHLLLAPLMLSADSAAYRAARPGLSAMIAVSQALDELRQGALLKPALAGRMLAMLPTWLDASAVAALARHGWSGAARRLLHDGRTLLQQLQQPSPQP